MAEPPPSASSTGLATSQAQGRASSVKEVAAALYLKEETERKTKVLSGVLSSATGTAASEVTQAKAMRQFAEATRVKVLSAAKHQVEATRAKQQVEDHNTTTSPTIHGTLMNHHTLFVQTMSI